LNIYIACGLTHVPRNAFYQYVEHIHSLAAALTESHCGEVRYALVDSDPQLAEKPFLERARLCYFWDREMVEASDLVVADATYPSTGLGIELQIAEESGIPIILSFLEREELRAVEIDYENPDHSHHVLQIGDGYVSLMALGLPGIFKVIRYRDSADGIKQIVDTVRLLKKEK
jgi:hypothetical protein